MEDQQKNLINNYRFNNKCNECKTNFSNSTNLRKHVRKFHPNKINELAPLLSSNLKFACDYCGKKFNYKSNWYCHMKTHKNADPQRLKKSENGISQNSKKCPMCNYGNSFKKEMLIHFKEMHEISIDSKDMQFSSIEDFEEWKNNMENNSHSKFVSIRGKESKISNYICHRSGNYVPEGKGLRRLKTQGSYKINAYCPASIKLIKDNDGKCKIHFIDTHVGHQTDVGHLTLTSLERQHLAAQIASKVPFDAILDEVRGSISDSNLKRIHLLTRKDLRNIESCFNLSSTTVRHNNDPVSVESWVNEMQREEKCVLFYKPQGILIDEHPHLKSEDFVLIIMTPAQCQLLKKYGSDCICLDGTHGLNSYSFELNTLLVLDDLSEGFPCAFLISNKSNKEVLSLFFSCIKKETGEITPKIFMSDPADTFYNAWLELMGIPERRLFCTWHVDQAWRKKLIKIKSKEQRVAIYKELRTLLEERDSAVFEMMMESFCSNIDNPEITDFIKYFSDNYFRNRQHWAYCYRLHAGLNTNMHLEKMHKTIKYIYLKEKNVKRLDRAISAISAIMRFIKDKLIDRLIVLNKGKICSKLKDIRSQHKNMQSLDESQIIQQESGGEVLSENQNEIYFLQESNKDCTCELIYQVESNTVPEAEDEILRINCDENVDESGSILTQLSKENDCTSLEEEKLKIKTRFLHHLNSITSPAQLAIVKNIIAPLSPTLAAIKNTNPFQSFPSTSKATPYNEKKLPCKEGYDQRKKKPKTLKI